MATFASAFALSGKELSQSHWADTREEVANGALWILALTSPLLVIASLSRISEIGFQPVMIVHVVVGCIVVGAGLARRQLGTRTKSLLIIGLMVVLAMAGMWTFGLATGVFVWFFAAQVLAMFMLGPRIAWMLVGFSLLFLVSMTVLVALGRLQFSIDFASYAYSTQAWLSSIVSFAPFVIGMMVALTVFYRAQQALSDKLLEKQKVEAMSKLTAAMAPELDDILGRVVASLESMRARHAGDADSQAACQIALDAAMRGTTMVQALLAYTRSGHLEPASCNLNGRIRDLAKVLDGALGEGIRLNLNLTPWIWRVKVDGEYFDSCLHNLVNNARDAMPAGGEVTITTRNERFIVDRAAPAGLPLGEYVVIEVADTGAGMSPAVRDRIFEPFFSTKGGGGEGTAANTGSGAGKATGLGLSMVFGFVRQSDGEIEVETVPGEGTSVHIFLPREVVDGGQSATPHPSHMEPGVANEADTDVAAIRAHAAVPAQSIVAAGDDAGRQRAAQQV